MMKSVTNQIYLKKAIVQFKNEKCNKIVDGLNVFNTLMCQLNSMDEKNEEEENPVMLLCPLPEAWNHLVTYISLRKIETLDCDTVVGSLLSEEV